jgi:hypothetical protein
MCILCLLVLMARMIVVIFIFLQNLCCCCLIPQGIALCWHEHVNALLMQWSGCLTCALACHEWLGVTHEACTGMPWHPAYSILLVGEWGHMQINEVIA